MAEYKTDDGGRLWFCDMCFREGDETHGDRETLVKHLEDEHGIVEHHDCFMRHDGGIHECDHEWTAWDSGVRECKKCPAEDIARA